MAKRGVQAKRNGKPHREYVRKTRSYKYLQPSKRKPDSETSKQINNELACLQFNGWIGYLIAYGAISEEEGGVMQEKGLSYAEIVKARK